MQRNSVGFPGHYFSHRSVFFDAGLRNRKGFGAAGQERSGTFSSAVRIRSSMYEAGEYLEKNENVSGRCAPVFSVSLKRKEVKYGFSA